MTQDSPVVVTATSPSPPSPAGCLVYDAHCRLCVAVQRRLQRSPRFAAVRFVPYDSRDAALALGERHHPGRPAMAYWVDNAGDVHGGPEAFLPLLPSLPAGAVIGALWRVRVTRRLARALYRLVAKHRYRWFGPAA